MQLHLQRAMHFLQSESLGLPPPQSHLLTHLSLELPPHKHRAMHRRTGTHDGHPNFIWFTTQLLHSRPLFGQASPAGNKSSSISGTRARLVEGLFSIMFFWNQCLKKCLVRLGCLIYILVQHNTANHLIYYHWMPCLGLHNVLISSRFSMSASLECTISSATCNSVLVPSNISYNGQSNSNSLHVNMWLYTTGVEKYG